MSFLGDCCAEGYLEVEELDDRQSVVLRSRTRGELAALVADMPGSEAVLPGVALAAPTFVKPGSRRMTPVLVAVVSLLTVMVLVQVPVAELLVFGGFLLVLLLLGLVLFVSLSPWIAVGALVAWSVNRLRRQPTSTQLH